MFFLGTKVFWWQKRRQEKIFSIDEIVSGLTFSQIFDWAAGNIEGAAAHRYQSIF